MNILFLLDLLAIHNELSLTYAMNSERQRERERQEMMMMMIHGCPGYFKQFKCWCSRQKKKKRKEKNSTENKAKWNPSKSGKP